MPKKSQPRSGSLQFWPRKRARKFLPSVNWSAVVQKKKGKTTKKDISFLGFIGYKAGMKTIIAKDLTEHSLTKGKKISIPCTIIECPPMKIFSIRFCKNKKTVFEILADNIDKEMKKKLRLPKKKTKDKEKGEEKERKKARIEDKLKELDKKIDEGDFDDIRVIVYSVVKKTNIKKKPDISEIALSPTNSEKLKEKLDFIKSNLGKEISVKQVFDNMQLVDLRGLTKGKGIQGPVKRLGISLKDHKSEKGRRRPGTLGPWHPARVTFRAPMAGQMGFFTRLTYNNKILIVGDKEKIKKLPNNATFEHYGKIKNDYLVLRGSIQGPAKRQLLITPALRPTKKQNKKNFEIIEIK